MGFGRLILRQAYKSLLSGFVEALIPGFEVSSDLSVPKADS